MVESLKTEAASRQWQRKMVAVTPYQWLVSTGFVEASEWLSSKRSVMEWSFQATLLSFLPGTYSDQNLKEGADLQIRQSSNCDTSFLMFAIVHVIPIIGLC